MSSTATVALVVVGASGLFKVWRAYEPVASAMQFVDSNYGRTLLLKLALVAAAATLGAANRFVVLPRLFAELAEVEGGIRWRRGLVRVLRIEAAVLLLVLIAAVDMSNTEPPGSLELPTIFQPILGRSSDICSGRNRKIARIDRASLRESEGCSGVDDGRVP
jgi:putative copper export protein